MSRLKRLKNPANRIDSNRNYIKKIRKFTSKPQCLLKNDSEKLPTDMVKNIDNKPLYETKNKEEKIKNEHVAGNKNLDYRRKKTTTIQRKHMSDGVKTYLQTVRNGTQIKSPFARHGVFAYLKKKDVPEAKIKLALWANGERMKWLKELGGIKNLTYLEISMLDEATRLLLFCVEISEYNMMDPSTGSLYKDPNTGELRIHSAISKTYMAMTKQYCLILEKLRKFSLEKIKGGLPGSGKESGLNKGPASTIKDLYKRMEQNKMMKDDEEG